MATTLNYNWQAVATYDVATGGGAGIHFFLYAKLNKQEGNASVVDVHLDTTRWGNYVGGTGYGFWCTGAAWRTGTDVWEYVSETCVSGQVTIQHNADGRKNDTLYASAYNNYLGFNINFSGDITLPRIAKAPFVSNVETSAVTYNSVSASFSVTDNGGSAVTGTSLSIYSDSALTQLVQTQSGTSVTFTGLHPNRNYWIVGKATNAVGTRSSTALQVNTEGSIVRIRMNGEWKDTIPYVRVSGEWKEVTPYIRSNGQWKEGI